MGKRRAKTLLRLLVVLLLFVPIAGLYGFSCGKSAAEFEWQAKMPQERRSPSEMRGILESMLATRNLTAPPAFIPFSMWDDEVCAAAVVNAVNFILGEERLKVAPAWLFSRVNRDALQLTWDRRANFAIQGERVVEKYDRPIWLASLLRMAGAKPHRTAAALYIVGYLYRHTSSHELIVEAGGDLNSHLMLILGRTDGHWWGYHLLHDPEHPERNPFRIDDLGEQMPADFDLIYLWEVKGTDMPVQGTPMLLASRAPAYSTVFPYVGWGWNGRGEYIVDTALTKFRFWNREQFPRALRSDRTLMAVEPAWGKGAHGQLLGFYQGVPVYRHAQESNARTPYGQAYQCAELVNRFYAQRLGHRNMQHTGHADSYFYGAGGKGLQAFENGGTTPPQINDILVFDQPGKDDTHPGHVGIVYQVTDQKVCLVQQNLNPWYGCLPLTYYEGAYQVGPINQDLPCIGWARKR